MIFGPAFLNDIETDIDPEYSASPLGMRPLYVADGLCWSVWVLPGTKDRQWLSV